mmetsp:Transcript_110287/g.317256  ORF Transcript_110287/g.317256 Transcript_110287/m.317256 type:complete len:272 (-) Transcript_110287:3947-4762(-)
MEAMNQGLHRVPASLLLSADVEAWHQDGHDDVGVVGEADGEQGRPGFGPVGVLLRRCPNDHSWELKLDHEEIQGGVAGLLPPLVLLGERLKCLLVHLELEGIAQPLAQLVQGMQGYAHVHPREDPGVPVPVPRCDDMAHRAHEGVEVRLQVLSAYHLQVGLHLFRCAEVRDGTPAVSLEMLFHFQCRHLPEPVLGNASSGLANDALEQVRGPQRHGVHLDLADVRVQQLLYLCERQLQLLSHGLQVLLAAHLVFDQGRAIGSVRQANRQLG